MLQKEASYEDYIKTIQVQLSGYFITLVNKGRMVLATFTKTQTLTLKSLTSKFFLEVEFILGG